LNPRKKFVDGILATRKGVSGFAMLKMSIEFPQVPKPRGVQGMSYIG
jgi:hypothetical protein